MNESRQKKKLIKDANKIASFAEAINAEHNSNLNSIITPYLEEYLKNIDGEEYSVSRVVEILNDKNERDNYLKLLPNELNDKIEAYKKDFFGSRTNELKNRLANGETLEDIEQEAIALCTAAISDKLGMNLYNVQIQGAMVIGRGQVAEMKTGEGKTVTAISAAYLNALSGSLDNQGVHIHTSNEFLATEQSEETKDVYNMLGLSVGCLKKGMSIEDAKKAYNSDILYGSVDEFINWHLQDQMATNTNQQVSKRGCYAIVDEIDYALVDEGGKPHIISGKGRPAMSTSELLMYAEYADKKLRGYKVSHDAFVDGVEEVKDNITGELYDYVYDESNGSIMLLDSGSEKISQDFNIDWIGPRTYVDYNAIENALTAIHKFENGVDFIVENGNAINLNQATGRRADNTKWSFGLQQAIEARRIYLGDKTVKISSETKAMASTNIIEFLQSEYNNFGGMSATTASQGELYNELIDKNVVSINPNKESQRIDQEKFCLTENSAFEIIKEELVKSIYNEKGHQPILLIMPTVKEAEKLKMFLEKSFAGEIESGKTNLNFLTAANDKKESEIVARAGMMNQITISTNMASRGTDIKVGGNAKEFGKAKLLENNYDTDIIEAVMATPDKQNENYIPDYLPKDKYELYLEARKLFLETKKTFVSDKTSAINAGGLKVITTHSDSERVDQQKIGRAGRNGEPGETMIIGYPYLEDEKGNLVLNPLVRQYGFDVDVKNLEKLKARLDNLNDVFNPDAKTLNEISRVKEELEKWSERTVKNSQRHAESLKTSSIINMYKYNSVSKPGRDWLENMRQDALEMYEGKFDYEKRNVNKDDFDLSRNILDKYMESLINKYFENPSTDNYLKFSTEYKNSFNIDVDTVLSNIKPKKRELGNEKVFAMLRDAALNKHLEIQKMVGKENMEKIAAKTYFDNATAIKPDLLEAVDDIKNNVSFNSYAKKNPLLSYTQEVNKIYSDAFSIITSNTIEKIFDLKNYDKVGEKEPITTEEQIKNRKHVVEQANENIDPVRVKEPDLTNVSKENIKFIDFTHGNTNDITIKTDDFNQEKAKINENIEKLKVMKERAISVDKLIMENRKNYKICQSFIDEYSEKYGLNSSKKIR